MQTNNFPQKIYPLTDADIAEMIDYAEAEDSAACIRSICEKIKARGCPLEDVVELSEAAAPSDGIHEGWILLSMVKGICKTLTEKPNLPGDRHEFG